MRASTAPADWSSYWQSEPDQRCYVPGDGRLALDQQWAPFASALPRGAQLIDLGCGRGVLGRILLSVRGDLYVTGVDSASLPWTAQPRLTIHTAVAMEALPFEDRSFDAAVSLFGIEYGQVEATVRELERVLKPGAPFCFLVHHRESEIFKEGSARRRALRELTSGPMKSAFLSGDGAGVRRQQSRLRAAYPGQGMVTLVGDHYGRNIGCTRAERQALLEGLAGDLDWEITLLQQMERSAKSPSELGAWLAPFLSGMATAGASAVRRGSGEPIAWRVSGAR